MKTSTLALLASAGIAAAQMTTSAYVGNTICAMDVLEACLGTETLNVQACQANDWGCLCHAYGIVLGCYNDCPSDPGLFSAQQEQVANCNAANAYPSTSTAVAAVTTAAPAASNAHNTNAGTTAAVTGTPAASTASAAKATSTGAAAGLVVPAGGIALGLVGFFL